jgi:hypothetical protein
MVHGNHSFCECVYAPYFWSGSWILILFRFSDKYRKEIVQ